MSVFLFVFFCLFPNSSNTAKPIELKLSQKIPFGRQMILDKKIGLLFAKKKTKKTVYWHTLLSHYFSSSENENW